MRRGLLVVFVVGDVDHDHIDDDGDDVVDGGNCVVWWLMDMVGVWMGMSVGEGVERRVFVTMG